jgi:hypothetical protein
VTRFALLCAFAVLREASGFSADSERQALRLRRMVSL